MTDQELKDLVASLVADTARYKAENAAGFAALREAQAADAKALIESRQRSDAEMDEVKRVMKELGKRMGSMAQNQGDIAEEFFYNSLKDVLKVGDIKFDYIIKNMTAGNKKRQAQFDIVLVNGNSAAIIEVKHKAHTHDLDQIERLLDSYKLFHPEFKEYKLYGGIAGMSVPDDVAQEAKRKGYFVMKCKGDVLSSETADMRVF